MERIEELPVTPEELWPHLVDREALADWLGRPDFALEPGGEGAIDADGVTHHVVVEEVDAPRRLAWTWWPLDAERGVGPGSTVELVLEPTPTGTRLRIVEAVAAPTRYEARALAAA